MEELVAHLVAAAVDGFVVDEEEMEASNYDNMEQPRWDLVAAVARMYGIDLADHQDAVEARYWEGEAERSRARYR